MFGGNLVCGFGRLFGQLTGFLINSGPITAGDSQKGGHFVQVRTHGPGSGCLQSSFKVRPKHFSYSFVITETSLSSSSKMAGENKQSNMKIRNFQLQQICG